MSIISENAPRAASPSSAASSRTRANPTAAAILAGDRIALARAITLIESEVPAHREEAAALLAALMPQTGRALRLGITGLPGAGKSTFIDVLGRELCARGARLAVLAIDPSSTKTHGSILGDKTRMAELARHPAAFIRPSPSRCHAGGTARHTREAMLLCEAAGFDVVVIETVGVGQGEVTVRAMVDFFLLLTIPGAGDELQAIKRGIVELADAIIVNKADGDHVAAAELARQQFELALHLQREADATWQPRVRTCSALTGAGVPEIAAMLEEYRATTTATGELARRREQQALDWMRTEVDEALRALLRADPKTMHQREQLEHDVRAGRIDPTTAARRLLASLQFPGRSV